MKLWQSFRPVKANETMDNILKTMRHATFVTLPLLFAGAPAFAAEASDISPEKVGQVKAAMDAAAVAASQSDVAQVADSATANFFAQLGIPDYGQIFAETGFDVFQQLVNVNKFFIEFIDANLENTLGTDAGGFGFSLILYTCLIKTLLYPLYEGQLRSTARMRKVQPVMREI